MILLKQRPELITDLQNHILIEESFLSYSMCQTLIEFGEKHKTKDKSLHKGQHEVCGIDDSTEIHESLMHIWKKSLDFFESDIKFVETYLLKKYTKFSFFGRHIDNYISITDKIDRKLSMSVQLSDVNDYKGGDLVIEGVTCPKEIGTVVVFPSNYWHEIKPVSDGVRWSLVTWAWGPAF